jgi:hypothetical protein
VKYFCCRTCGFLQTEEPYWLGEAYSSAIASIDTGILYRNLLNQQVTTAVINVLFPRIGSALDFGAGHGIFVRLMRDTGFNFFWQDLHATNDYARGFEHTADAHYDFVTSFEVLEHLVDPYETIAEMMRLSPALLVSTELVPDPTPKVRDWWYYATASGQHVSFYSLESLRFIARKFGRHLVSCGPYHLFTQSPQSELLFRMATSQRFSGILRSFRKRKSLMMEDFRLLSGSLA